jgi:transposase
MRTKGSAAELERRRKLAVQRIQEGYTAAEVARFLGVHLRTVRRWLAAHREDPRHGLNATPHLGRPPRLTLDQDLEVLSWLMARPTAFGFATDLWTAPRIAQLIQKKFGVHFHPRYVNAWLRDRGVTPQKPQRQPRERDPAAIETWLAEDWVRIQTTAREEAAHVVLIDESGCLLAPLLRRSQALRGHTPVCTQPGGHRDKVSIIAALTVSPVRQHLGLYFQTIPHGYVTAPTAAAFLHELLRHLRGRVIAVWDRGPIHKGPDLRQLLRRFPRLSVESLPPYAPDLNPVEFLWNHLKYDQLANLVPAGVLHLNCLVQATLEVAGDDQQRLRSCFEASELPFPEPMAIAS